MKMATPLEDDVEMSNGAETEKYLRWPREMDKLLLDALKEEKAKQNSDGKQINKEVWKNVITVLNIEFQKIGKKIEKGKAVNRLKTIQKLTCLANELLNRSGFGWNDITKKVEATPSVWQRVIQLKPEYKLLRDRELYFLEDSSELLGKDHANGDCSKGSKESIHRQQMERDLCIEDIDDAQVNNDIDIDQLDLFGGNVPSSPMIQDNASSVPSHSKALSRGDKRKKTMSDVTADESLDVDGKNIYSTSEISTELKKLALDKWEVMEALDFLKDNEHLVDRFFACDDDIKLAWLKKKMGLTD